MKIGRLRGLLLLLSIDLRVNGEGGETLSSFLRDMMATFGLASPTIVYNSDETAPEICYTDPWVLCLHPGLPSWYPEDSTTTLANESESDKELENDGMHLQSIPKKDLQGFRPSSGFNSCTFQGILKVIG